MDIRKDLVFLTLFGSVLLLASGLILISALISGVELEGIVLGAGFGLWLVVGFLIARNICADRKNKKTPARLILFLAGVLDVCFPYWYELQLPYLGSFGKPAGRAALEQIVGMLGASMFATGYLSLREYRRLRNLTMLACLPLLGSPGSFENRESQRSLRGLSLPAAHHSRVRVPGIEARRVPAHPPRDDARRRKG